MPVKLGAMPGRGYPKLSARVHPALLARFAAAAEAAGVDRAALLRALVRWWLREPGARMPKRPVADTTVDDGEGSNG